MLVLTRKTGQSIVIDGGIEITVLEVRGEQVRLGIAAPREIKVNRKELLAQIEASAAAEAAAAALSNDDTDTTINGNDAE